MYLPVTVNCRTQAHDDWIERSLSLKNLCLLQFANNVGSNVEVSDGRIPWQNERVDREKFL
jgi:hypothetical protein